MAKNKNISLFKLKYIDMKKLIIVSFLFAFSMNAQIKTDKYYHAGAGIILSSSMYTIGQYTVREMNPVAPSLIAISGGAAKEFFDVMNGKTFSYSDFACTALSGIATNAIMRAIWKPKKKKVDIFDIKNDPLITINP